MANSVDKIISENEVVIFSKSYCPYSAKAKRVLSKYNIKRIKIVELDEIEDSNQADIIQEYLFKITGANSVPRVFIGGKFIGGSDEITKIDHDEKLIELLKNAGALTD